MANFEKLIANVTGFGTVYNPSKENIKIPALIAPLETAKGAITNVNLAEPAYKNAVSASELAFKQLSKLIIRVNNSLKASDSSTQVDDSAMTLVRKLQSRRSTPKMTEDEKQATTAEGKAVNEASFSQMSYDSRLDNFDKYIKLLASVLEYAPNSC